MARKVSSGTLTKLRQGAKEGNPGRAYWVELERILSALGLGVAAVTPDPGFTADNTIVTADSGSFTADQTIL